MSWNMIFNGWGSIGRTLIVGILAYGVLIFILRVSGKRTLSKMNAFDFVVTVALGSTLATVLISQDVSLMQGITALALLVFLQYLIAWLSVHSKQVSRLVKADPSLLFFRGRFLEQALEVERVTKEEVLSAVRAQGIPSLQGVEGVVLESDGSFTVISLAKEYPPDSLRDVKNAPEKLTNIITLKE